MHNNIDGREEQTEFQYSTAFSRLIFKHVFNKDTPAVESSGALVE